MRATRTVRRLCTTVVMVILGLPGCSDTQGTQPVSTGFGMLPEPIALVSTPRQVMKVCLGTAAVSEACPRLVPETEKQYRTDAFSSQKGHWTFFAESSGPYPGITRKNAPPRFAHINVQAGDLSKAFPFLFRFHGRPDGLPKKIPRKRADPLYLGRFRWGERHGALVLAPSFPTGGIEGDHLIFGWVERDIDYAISVHAWKPLDQCAATLKSIVASIA
jgi:hypothetical protein